MDSCRQQSRGPRATAGHDHLDQEARRSHGEGAIGEPGTGDSAPLVTVGGSIVGLLDGNDTSWKSAIT